MYIFTILRSKVEFNLFQLERSFQRFTTFYNNRHSGRKLNWLYQMCKGELVTNCFKNRYTLQVGEMFDHTFLLQMNIFHHISMAKSSQLMPLINTGNYRGGTNDKPGPTI